MKKRENAQYLVTEILLLLLPMVVVVVVVVVVLSNEQEEEGGNVGSEHNGREDSGSEAQTHQEIANRDPL